MNSAYTFTATIYLGLREGYSSIAHSMDEVEAVCQEYCDKIGLCVTVTPTKYIYTNGNESGCIIGLINYPRFPDHFENILDRAFDLAKILMKEFKQTRISVLTPFQTYMFEESDLK